MIKIKILNKHLILNKLSEQAEYNNSEFIVADITNSFKNSVIVEQVGESVFKINKTRPLWGYSGNSLSNYEALVSFNETTCTIVIKIKKWIFYAFIVWYVFFSLLTLFLMLQNIGGEFFIILLVIAPIALAIEKKKFKKFIINYIDKMK